MLSHEVGMPPKNTNKVKVRVAFLFCLSNILPATPLISIRDMDQSQSEKTGPVAISVSSETLKIQEKGFETSSLLQRPPSSNAEAGTPIEDRAETGSSGMRLYSFVLEAKEKLTVKMSKEKGGEIFMRFLRPSRMDAMESQFRRVAMMPAASRASKVDITNITNEPYPVILMVHGQNGIGYELNIERSGKKKP